ncbi:hypothetical protein NQD34_008329, partial [Periophthalmus magnuspinnatus]
VSKVEDGRRGDEDHLEDEVAKVRNGEGLIVADRGAAGLAGVANEVGLFVIPGGLCGGRQD